MFFLDIYSSDNRLTWGPFSSMFDFIHPIRSPKKTAKKHAGTWDSFLWAVFSPGGCKTKGEEPYGPEWLELPAGFQGVELAWWGWGWGCHNFVLNDDCLMILLWLGWGCFMHYYHILSWFMHGKDVKYPWNQMNCQFPIWYPWPLSPPQKSASHGCIFTLASFWGEDAIDHYTQQVELKTFLVGTVSSWEVRWRHHHFDFCISFCRWYKD